MKTAAKRYHWISSSPLELTPKALRTMALPALMRVVARISHMVSKPMRLLRLSVSRESFKRSCMLAPERVVRSCRCRLAAPVGDGWLCERQIDRF
jgi:hypothetical protein